MTASERTQLLFGPYRVPRLKRGDRELCLYRDALVQITGISNARISWPLCRRPTGRSHGRGLLVDEELGRAVRTEAAVAVAYWWGVHVSTVVRWRRALEVTLANNPGTRRLRLAAVVTSLAVRTPVGVRKVPTLWTARESALVGTAADAEVARQLDRTREAVAHRRKALGLPARRAVGARWTARELALVGTAPDAEVARKTGRSRYAVAHQRKALGLPARRAEGARWSAAELALLGAVPDVEAARKTGRSRYAVTRRRKALGLPARRAVGAGWTAAELALLGIAPDAEVARKTGRSLNAVGWQRRTRGRAPVARAGWTVAELALLGTAPDVEVGRKLGRSRAAINGKRKALGIAAQGARGPGQVFWTAAEVALLGVVPDAEVSRRIGRGLSAVSEKRRRLGIAAVVPGPRGQHACLWTAEEDEILRRYSPVEAARRLNRSLSAIYPHRRALGIAVKRKPRGAKSV